MVVVMVVYGGGGHTRPTKMSDDPPSDREATATPRGGRARGHSHYCWGCVGPPTVRKKCWCGGHTHTHTPVCYGHTHQCVMVLYGVARVVWWWWWWYGGGEGALGVVNTRLDSGCSQSRDIPIPIQPVLATPLEHVHVFATRCWHTVIGCSQSRDITINICTRRGHRVTGGKAGAGLDNTVGARARVH